jgi:hypothetical protein
MHFFLVLSVLLLSSSILLSFRLFLAANSSGVIECMSFAYVFLSARVQQQFRSIIVPFFSSKM